jgi:hypothetical protein
MYKEQMEIINSWEKFLAGIAVKMESSIKTILNETLNNKNIFVMFFEYEYDDMDIMFYTIDKNENILSRKIDVLNDELNCKHLFPKDLFERQMEIDDTYDGEDDNYEDYREKYSQIKDDIFKNWFMKCWDKIKGEYKNIPKTYFSIHDTNYKIDLETKEKIKYDEIIK